VKEQIRATGLRCEDGVLIIDQDDEPQELRIILSDNVSASQLSMVIMELAQHVTYLTRQLQRAAKQ
jgi:hypothetical protein